MKWNLRLAAANRGIWKASEFQRLLGERGLVISAGKMSGLWSGEPHSIKLDELEVICSVLDCGPEELLLREPDTVASAERATATDASAVGDEAKRLPAVRPRAPGGRSLPPS
jgi:DNA-binding Xre family transcriptional regulator